MEFEGYEAAEGERTHASENYVDPGFFQMMDIELLQGRGFTREDGPGTEDVVIVNEALAERYWPGANPLGKTIRWWRGETFRVVGVVRDHFYSSLRRGVEPLTYYPLFQYFLKNPVLLVRGRSDPLALVPAVRAAVREVNPELVLFAERTLEGQVAASASRERITAVLLFAYAGLALLLAIIGTYGMVSRLVVRRWKEIGIRTALGAGREELLYLVFRKGMGVVVLGLVTGLLLSLSVGVLLRSMIFGVAPVDLPTLASVAGALATVGAVACLIPARRALTADPAEVLREE
jgi:predicted permease